MAITLVATVGSASANTYVDEATADAYFETRFNVSSWTSLSAGHEDKKKALVQATRHIERHHRFRGDKNSSSQALAFPRDMQEEASNALPLCVKEACCEEALWILQHSTRGGLSQRQQLQQEGVKSYGVGDLREEFGAGGSSSLSPEAARLLGDWIDRTGRILSDGLESPGEPVWWPFE